MLVHQVFNRSVNRVFILGNIQNIQPNTLGQTFEYHIIMETQEGLKDKFVNQKTQTEQHYIVLDHSFAEDLKAKHWAICDASRSPKSEAKWSIPTV